MISASFPYDGGHSSDRYRFEPDWWSLGVTIFALLSMHGPFSLEHHLKAGTTSLRGGAEPGGAEPGGAEPGEVEAEAGEAEPGGEEPEADEGEADEGEADAPAEPCRPPPTAGVAAPPSPDAKAEATAECSSFHSGGSGGPADEAEQASAPRPLLGEKARGKPSPSPRRELGSKRSRRRRSKLTEKECASRSRFTYDLGEFYL